MTPRFLRHFNLITVTEFGDDTYTRIYSAVLDWWFRRAKAPDDVRGKAGAVVKATLEVYNTIRAELLPTPAKSHYTYNMRDLSKVGPVVAFALVVGFVSLFDIVVAVGTCCCCCCCCCCWRWW